jgi:hypothetical protein
MLANQLSPFCFEDARLYWVGGKVIISIEYDPIDSHDPIDSQIFDSTTMQLAARLSM